MNAKNGRDWKWLEREASQRSTCDLSVTNWDRCSTAAAAMMEILLATFGLRLQHIDRAHFAGLEAAAGNIHGALGPLRTRRR